MILNLLKSKIIFLGIFLVGLNVLLRIIFFYFNYSDVVPLTEYSQAFLIGLRFDIATSAVIILPILLLSYLHSGISGKIQNVYFIMFSVIITIFSISDAQYYKLLGNRFDFYAITHLQYFSDHLGILNMGWVSFFAIIALFVTIILSASYYTFSDSIKVISYKSTRQKFIHSFLLFIILIVCIRGGIQNRPLKQSQSVFSNYKLANDIATNSIYRFYHLLDYYFELKNSVSQNNIQNYVSPTITIESSGKILSEYFGYSSESFSLIRKHNSVYVHQKKNVVLIIVESFAADFIHSMGSINNDTPYFDSILHKGVLFDNFYANGTHTNEGLSSLLAGYPLLPQGDILSRPELIDGIQTLPSIMKNNNYFTKFIYGGRLTFDNMFSFFNISGIDNFIGREHFPDKLNQTYWGIIDEHVYDTAVENLPESPQPFFATILTLSNHHPWDVPLDSISPVTSGTENMNRRNTFRYTDWALHHFLEEMKRINLYENSIFIITADHGQYLYNDYDIEPRNFRIPLFILNSELEPHINHTLGSQIDLIPTIMDLMGISGNISSFGRSLLRDENNTRFVPLIQKDSPVLLFSDHAYLDLPSADHGILYKFKNNQINSVKSSYQNDSYKFLVQSLLFTADYSITNYKFLRP